MDVHGDAIINLGHNDSVTLTDTTSTQLRQVIQAVRVLAINNPSLSPTRQLLFT